MSNEAESTKPQCAVPGCPWPAKTRGVCDRHYFHRHDEGEGGQLIRHHMLPSRRGHARQAGPRAAIQRKVGPGAVQAPSADQPAVAALREFARLLGLVAVDLPVEGGHAFIARGGTAVLRADGTLAGAKLRVGE